nr:hypothetical protein TDPV-340 [Oriental turtle dovepox virus]
MYHPIIMLCIFKRYNNLIVLLFPKKWICRIIIL